MKELLVYYTAQIEKLNFQLNRTKQRLLYSSMMRLAIFLIVVIGCYFLKTKVRFALLLVLIGIGVFILLIKRHFKLHNEKKLLNALIDINETEIKYLHRDFAYRPTGNKLNDPNHYYSQDIDLFGEGSFYQYINRTSLAEGSKFLARLLSENNTKNIDQRQAAIAELSQMTEWRQEFLAKGSLIRTDTTVPSIILWLSNYKPFVPSFLKYLPPLFSLFSIGLLVSFYFSIIPESLIMLWLIIGIFITALFIKPISKLTSDVSKITSLFQQYKLLLHQLESTNFKSELLSHKLQILKTEKIKAHEAIQAFSALLNKLDRNNNIFYAILANGLFLRTLVESEKIEHWIKKHRDKVDEWFSTVAFYDAYISLSTFAFNHPSYVYPVITNDEWILQSNNAGHPLLAEDKCVLNDINIKKEQFFIITGANMAGKSTFLRTVSLQIIMANIGLPLYATHVAYSPIKLITSMRSTDSLANEESYFFSELKRLKFIIDEIEKDQYFIILDEILKGTNSTDKAIGSKKFIEKLVGSKSTGIIATHDLSLCQVAELLPQVKNYYFDAEIINDELHFDYQLKTGICQNMNASFLLRKMNIVDS